MRQGSEGTRGGTGPRREGRRSDADTSFTPTYGNRSRFSFTTSRDRCDMRWDSEAERYGCVAIGRMRRGAESEDDEIAETAD